MQVKQSQLHRRHLVIHVVLGACSGGTMALAAFLLIAPDIGPPPVFPFQDKLFHAVCFAALAGPAVLVLPTRYLGFWLSHMLILGAGIEIVQAMEGSGRSASVWDFLADVAGIALAFAIGQVIRARIGGNEPR